MGAIKSRRTYNDIYIILLAICCTDATGGDLFYLGADDYCIWLYQSLEVSVPWSETINISIRVM